MKKKTDSVVIAAFSEDHAERLTGVSKRQLRYWDRTGFFQPAFVDENRRAAFSRVYSFRDITSLRVLNVLRNQYNVPLQHLRKVARELAHLSEARWTATTLFVLNKKVIFLEPGSDKYREIVGKQYVIGIPLQTVVADTKRDIAELNIRPIASRGKIERHRLIAQNTFVIAGTRIPVQAIKDFHKAGYSTDQIIAEYPDLTSDDIKAALNHQTKDAAA